MGIIIFELYVEHYILKTLKDDTEHRMVFK